MALTPRERKAALVARGITQRKIAVAVGVSAPHVHDVIEGNRRSARVEQFIAQAIGLPRDVVFPTDNAA